MDVPTDKHDRRMKYSEKRGGGGFVLVDNINTLAIISCIIFDIAKNNLFAIFPLLTKENFRGN